MANKKNAQTPAAESSNDPRAEQAPQTTSAPVRRYFAGGGHVPELNLFVGSGQVLAEQQPDGTWKLVSEDALVPAAEMSSSEAANAPQDQESAPSEEPTAASEPAAEAAAAPESVATDPVLASTAG